MFAFPGLLFVAAAFPAIHRAAKRLCHYARVAYIVIALSVSMIAYVACQDHLAFGQSADVRSRVDVQAVMIEELKNKNIQQDTHISESDKALQKLREDINTVTMANLADENKRFEDMSNRQWWIIGLGGGALGLLAALQAVMALGLKISRD